MFTKLREPFGKAGLTVAVLALVMAMVGGAYAAGGLTKSQEKQVTKIAKKYAGKPGATGPAGAAGTNGTAGKDGANGTNGTNGAPGESVKVTESANAIEGHCTGGTSANGKGGTKFEVGATKTYACNGKEGAEGTFGGQTLPSGQTLRGHWAGTGFGSEGFPEPGVGQAYAAASYPLPVEVGAVSHTHYVKEGEATPTGCSGNVISPDAEPGNLCVFAESEVNVDHGSGFGIVDDTLGFLVSGFTEAAGRVVFAGTWAVTAE